VISKPASRTITAVNASSENSNPYAQHGELIGSYRVVRELGRGGMAVVYLAERADGQYSQQVALKILRFGMADSPAQFHFAQERQILASLDHQSIARLIDAGTTATGSPYLAMEYVEGAPIDRYCDEQRLSLDARLQLFLKVADAVQYAHRHLIVHRDLKPSNIVVTSEGAVKLLDFGIAKLLASNAPESAGPPTVDGIWLMTPEYASSEQAHGKPVTTATDIYQLGFLLYTLLTGREPYNVRGRNSVDALRVIRESEPAPPNLPRRDLDAIVLKALSKEPGRQYASVQWLIDDIRRYQQGLAVSALEGLRAYRVAKFCRRHMAVLALTGVAIITVAFVTAWYTVQLAGERNRARHEAESAEQVAEFLASVFRGPDSRAADGAITARELVDRGALRIEAELAGQPKIKAHLMNVIGDVYVQYDLQDKAQPLLDRALLLNTRLFGENSREVADSQHSLAKLARNRGDPQKAKELYEQALRIRESTLGPRHPATADTLSELAFTFFRLGDARAAMQASERAVDIYSHSVGPDDERTLSAMNRLAAASLAAGELMRGRAQYEQLLPRVERTLGAEHRLFASTLGNIGSVKAALGDYEGTEQQLWRSKDIFERLYGPDHGDVALRSLNLASFFFYSGRPDESIAMCQHVIDTQRKVSGPGHPREAQALWGIGLALRSRGDLQEALERLQSALEMLRKEVGPSHSDYARVLQAYGETQLEMNNLAAAAPAIREAVSILRRTRPPDHYELAAARVSNALLLTRIGKPVEAEKELRQAIASFERKLPAEHRLPAVARSALGEALLAQGKIAEAEGFLVSSVKQLGSGLYYEQRLALRRLSRLYELKGASANVGTGGSPSSLGHQAK